MQAQDASSIEGTHKELETDAGSVRVGVSNLDSNERNERTTGVAEIGYILRGKRGGVIPESLSIIPFVRSHFESDDQSREANARSGVGIDFQVKQLTKNSRLVFRLTADESDARRGSGTETAASVFIQRSFGGIDEQNEQIQRIRRLREPVVVEVELSNEVVEEHNQTVEQRKLIHYYILSFYILKVRHEKRDAGIREQDPFLDDESSTDEIIDWLYDHLIDRYPLFYTSLDENEISSRSAGSMKGIEIGLFSPTLLLDDFIEKFEEQLEDS